MSRPAPPSGQPPPATATLADGGTVELRPIAQAICRRYDEEFPDERERYGPAGKQWCEHDNLWLLSWAITDAEIGVVSLENQVRWLAGVLESRGFPLERLARDLEIAAEEVGHDTAAARLREAAAMVRDQVSPP